MDVKKIIQKILPDSSRSKLMGNYLVKKYNDRIIEKNIIRLYGDSSDPDMVELLEYVKMNHILNISGVLVQQNMVFEYLDRKIVVLHDEEFGLPYVMHKGMKMYFPRTMTDEVIEKYYLSNFLEQDTRSAHCYFRDMSIYPENGIFVDLGAAEGNFSLDLIDKAKHIYLFEGDQMWLEPLKATFHPFEEKVTIIPKYVSDKESETTITLSTALKDVDTVDVIKMDIEGAETTVIENSIEYIKNLKNTNLIVCTYHKENDEYDIKALLPNYIFKEQGYIIGSNRNILHPYVRRVLMIGHNVN